MSDRGTPAIVNATTGRRIITHPSTLPARVRQKATMATLRDPAQLTRYLAGVETELEELGQRTASNPFASGVLVQSIPMTAGASVIIDHRLRRAVKGWLVARLRGGGGGVYPVIIETTLPAGRDPKQYLQLEASQVCTLDVYVY